MAEGEAIDVTGTVSGYFGGLDWGALITVAVYGIFAICAVAFAIIFIRNFIKFRYYGVLIKRRQDQWGSGTPSYEKIEGKAGYFTKSGLEQYRIKHGPMPWQQVWIKKLPDPQFMQGRTAYFLQYNIGEIVQAKQVVNWKKGDIDIEPVDSTTKAAAKSELRAYTSIFSVKNKLAENAGIIIMGFIFIAGIVALYFVNKACS